MPYDNFYSINNKTNSYSPNFKSKDNLATGILAKPIETVQKAVEASVDTFAPSKDENTKKKRKRAIAVGSSIVVLSGLVALLNPRFSSKAVMKLKQWQSKAQQKIEQNPNSFINKFHKASSKFFDKIIQLAQFSNNINSAKDVGFKWFCIGQKEFNGIKNDTLRSFMQNVDSGWRKIMTTPYNAITRWFDNIGKSTVKRNYKSALKQLDEFEFLIRQHKSRLPQAKQKLVEEKLAEIAKIKEFYSPENLANRFKNQEDLMSDLESEFIKKYRSYMSGFKNGSKSEHFNNNLTFWAEDIMMPTRNKTEQEGLAVIEQIMGNTGGQKGKYKEILELFEEHINNDDKMFLNKILQKAKKKIHKANHSECVEYFDKKRDLVLGGAPTDVITAAVGLGASGIALSTAHDKDERTSRLLTGVFPVIAGLGASMAFTAMLFSGVKGMLLGGLTGLGLNFIGSKADDMRLQKKKLLAQQQNKINTNSTQNKTVSQEVKHA